MRLTKFTFFILMIFSLNTFAYKIQSALIPENSQTDNYILVTIFDKNCINSEFNARITTVAKALNACWTQENDNIKVTINETKEIRIIPSLEFKYMGESLPPTSTVEQRKDTKVTLTCVADAWAGDIVIERNKDGSLKSMVVSGEQVNPSEQGNSINFSYNGMNISLSTLTGVFNYETSGFQKYLNNRLLGGGSAKGAGACKVNNNQKIF